MEKCLVQLPVDEIHLFSFYTQSYSFGVLFAPQNTCFILILFNFHIC